MRSTTTQRTRSARKHERDIAAIVARGHENLAAGRYAEAEGQFKKVITARPRDVETLHLLGAIALQLDQSKDAVEYLARVLELNPNHILALGNYGLALHRLGRLPEAIEALTRALTLKPDYGDAHYNLGLAYSALNDIEAAAGALRKAVALAPDDATLRHELADVLQRLGRHDEAMSHFARTVELDPSCLSARINLLNAQQRRCDWREVHSHAEYLRDAVRSGSSSKVWVSPLAFITVPGTTAAEHRTCAEAAALVLSSAVGEPSTLASRAVGARVKLGYLSCDFGDHPVGHLMSDALRLHDRTRFDVSLYSYGDDDGTTVRAANMQATETCVDLNGLSDAAAAQRIRADSVDILVDLTGYSNHARTAILAHRAAPIQVNYLGYPGTMGAPFMDYIIADDFLIPPASASHFTEQIAYLPSYLVTSRRREIAATPCRTEAGLPDRGFVFGSFNQNGKITAELFDVWMSLLASVPDSVLWMIALDRSVPVNLRASARVAGVDPSRLVFASRVAHAAHLGRLALADLMLDTLYYNGGTTTVDALWAGVPVVTCAGETYASRVAGSLLTAHGVPELITHNLDDYYRLALDLASNPARYAEVRSRVKSQRDTGLLFDSERTTRELERLYERLAR